MSDPVWRPPLRFVWQIDAEGRFTLDSDKFLALAGSPTTELQGQPWDILASALGLDPDRTVARALETRETFSGLSITWPAGGARLAIELSGLPVFDRERSFRGYRGFGVCRGVCAHRQAEPSEPVAAVPAFNAIMSAMHADPTTVMSATPLDVPPKPAAHADDMPALSAIEHRTFQELSKRLTELVTTTAAAAARLSEATPREEAGRAQTQQNETPGERFAPAGRHDSAPPNKELAVALESAQNKIAELHAILDSTRQELIEARAMAEKQADAKPAFLAKISHELRTQLNTILGFAEVMMQERFGPVHNVRYRQYLTHIHASGGQLIALIGDLLDLSNIESGRLDLCFTKIAVNDIIAQCVTQMQPQANRGRILIRTSLSSRLPRVSADARSLKEIVLNLLSNSIKSIGPGGQIIVSSAGSEAGGVVVRVRDSGAGMSETELATAMEPFGQLATSTRFGSGGSGLRLPLTKALTEANRANFRITSTAGNGTLVEVSFPAERLAAE
jgi:signal transduction histidine kinase